MLPNSTAVFIVGAGPTGYTLAIKLQQQRIPFVLIDKLAQGRNTSRAAVIHAHTLEELEDIGVSQTLVQLGRKLANFAIRDRDRSLLKLRFDKLRSPYPYLLMIPQDVTETVLADRLSELGGRVYRNTTATGFERVGEITRVTVTSDAGDQTVDARFVIGGDGMHSVVRQASEITFDGASYAETFLLADVEMDWPLGHNEVSLFFSPKGLVVVAPLPNGSYRVIATVESAPEVPTVADVQVLIDERGPVGERSTVRDVAWGTRFRIHHRLASSYRLGPMFLMGDAAHVHSPAGGQGMNTGIVDALVLGRVLTDVINGQSQGSALYEYEKLRRPAAAQVLGLADRLTSLATMRSQPRRLVRNAVLSLIDKLPFAKQRLVMNLSGLGRKHLARVPRTPEGSIPIRAENARSEIRLHALQR